MGEEGTVSWEVSLEGEGMAAFPPEKDPGIQQVRQDKNRRFEKRYSVTRYPSFGWRSASTT
jgi:hypothetical protein